MDDFSSFDKNTLRDQLKALHIMKREVRFYYLALLIGFICLLVFGKGRGISGFIVFFVFLVILRTATVWYQWDFLIRFRIKCPSCKKPLAERHYLFNYPNHNCPHCGKIALVPVKQLIEFEKSESGKIRERRN